MRWFASSEHYENPEVMCLLDSLLDAAASKSNSSLRELGCNLVAEFAKWTLKYQTNPTEKGSSTNH